MPEDTTSQPRMARIENVIRYAQLDLWT